MELITFIDRGGPINWVLFALLCICFCQCLERGIYFFSTRRGSKKEPLLRLSQKDAQLLHLEPEKRRRALEKEGGMLYHEMNRGMWFLNFTGAVAPSLGLLGTVTGLITAFGAMAESGTAVNMQDLSGGIWEAMLTTAFGMTISIPALLCYRTFRRIIEKRMMVLSMYDQLEQQETDNA